MKYNGHISVTRVLKANGLSDFSGVPPELLETARRRGRDVAMWTHLVDTGHGDELGEPDEAIAGYLEAWERFKSESGFELIASEEVLVSDEMRVGGTLDRRAYLRALREPDVEWVLDGKCVATISKATALQTAGYDWLSGATYGHRVRNRGSVQMRPDGTYRLQRYEGTSDQSIFLYMLNATHWRIDNGFLTREELDK